MSYFHTLPTKSMYRWCWMGECKVLRRHRRNDDDGNEPKFSERHLLL